MKTEILKVDPEEPEPLKIKAAAKILHDGGLVAFPTETVYGLGADAFNPEAVKKIFEVKGRPSDNPLIVHVASISEVYRLAKEVPKKAERLMKRFWPGPLTLVFKKMSVVPDIVTAGLDTVAIRMPDNEAALAMIREAGTPIVAPSANTFSKPSPTTPGHVVSDLYGKIELILDGGNTRIGVESTVVDVTTDSVLLLRPGGLDLEEIEAVVGRVELHPAVKAMPNVNGHAAKAPGMKYKHYAPNAKVVLVEGGGEKIVRNVNSLIRVFVRRGSVVGVITMREGEFYDTDKVKFMRDFNTFAKNLFTAFREFDKIGVDVIIVEGVEERGLGLAIMNRLRKASSQIIHV